MAGCGEEFTVVLSDVQQVWAFGLGNVGQMGKTRRCQALDRARHIHRTLEDLFTLF